MALALSLVAAALFYLSAIYATFLTKRTSMTVTILLIVLLGPLGVTIVLWRSFGPIPAIVTLIVAFVAIGAFGLEAEQKSADMAGVERSIAAQLTSDQTATQVHVSCPIIGDWDPGNTFTCDAQAGKKDVKVVVTMEEDLHFEWKVRKSHRHGEGVTTTDLGF